MIKLKDKFRIWKIKKILEQVNQWKEHMRSLNDEELQSKTVEFKGRLAQGESLDALLPEAFAAIREASFRVLGMFPYDVQVMGGIVLHQGHVAEMKTGEGKTLTAIMPLYLNALTGESTMLITVNEYLAQRDAEEMGPVYRFMGLTSASAIASEEDEEDMTPAQKRAIYASDIVYTTNSALGFDYLIENLADSRDKQFLRPFSYVLIDEVDAVLLDSSQTPLVISGSPRVQSNLYTIVDTLVTTMVEGVDYKFKEEKKELWLTQEGIKAAESFLGVHHLYVEDHGQLVRHLTLALRAHKFYEKNKDYLVRAGEKGDEVVLLDGQTGRLLEMTRMQGGQHQAIEAKEKAELTPEMRSMASITYQNFFKMFKKISGMTGTGKVAEAEFLETYAMKVIQIPTNRPVQRKDLPDNLYETLPEKVFASLEAIKEYHAKGNPILVFTGSVEMSNIYSSLLLREGISHNLLNANNAAREAQMIAEAGQKGAVIVATSMAGRGTDIKLGPGVKELGGLVVIGTERMENQRIDLQIRGRSGRQGDPGMSKFFVSLEDDLLKKWGPSWVRESYHSYTIAQTEKIPKVLTQRKFRKMVEKAQDSSEGAGRSSRKKTLDYAQSMNVQRTIVYKERNRLLDRETRLDREIAKIIEHVLDKVSQPELYSNPADLYRYLLDNVTYNAKPVAGYLDMSSQSSIRTYLEKIMLEELEKKKDILDPHQLYNQFQKIAILKAIDENWIEQVDYLQQLQQVLGTQYSSERNPVVEYYQAAYDSFEAMKERIKEQALRNLLLSSVAITPKGEIIIHYP